jgi:hypothetical protein
MASPRDEVLALLAKGMKLRTNSATLVIQVMVSLVS